MDSAGSAFTAYMIFLCCVDLEMYVKGSYMLGLNIQRATKLAYRLHAHPTEYYRDLHLRRLAACQTYRMIIYTSLKVGRATILRI
eukprot:127714-Pelagomonas_calceolata.AAC.2